MLWAGLGIESRIKNLNEFYHLHKSGFQNRLIQRPVTTT